MWSIARRVSSAWGSWIRRVQLFIIEAVSMAGMTWNVTTKSGKAGSSIWGAFIVTERGCGCLYSHSDHL